MALSNFQMKITDLKGKDSFYTAERAIEEIRVGLQEDVGDSMSEAVSAKAGCMARPTAPCPLYFGRHALLCTGMSDTPGAFCPVAACHDAVS